MSNTIMESIDEEKTLKWDDNGSYAIPPRKMTKFLGKRPAVGLAVCLLLCASLLQWRDMFRSNKRSMKAVETVQVKGARLSSHQAILDEAKAIIQKAVDDHASDEHEQPLNDALIDNNGKAPKKPDNTIRQTVPPHVRKSSWEVREVDTRKSVNHKQQQEPIAPEDRTAETAFQQTRLSHTMAHPSENHKPTPPQTQLSSNITVEKPIFVLSLPNSGRLATNRFFKCAGLDSGNLGRYWTKTDQLQIGHCMNLNRHGGRGPKALLKGCGDYKVWTEMDYDTRMGPRGIPKCLIPSLRPDVLTELFTSYPEATVINVRKDPEEWYQTLSPLIKKRWSESCNDAHHGKVFPDADAPKVAWKRFYQDHHKNLRETVAHYPSLSYIEIDLTVKPVDNAILLQDKLGIPGKCWWKVAANKTLPTDITYPIFVASLPKSATKTTHNYLQCGIGRFEGSHQYTKNPLTQEPIPIGECFRNNIRSKRPITENCGDNKHWADVGTLQPGNKCFYPSFMEGGLEAIYKAHPYATIVHTTRDSHNWYKSAKNWMDSGFDSILTRWTRNCKAFPREKDTNEAAWTEFYDWHTKHVRDFAKQHPTMNYVEIKVENKEDTLKTLQDNFGFKNSCWGHSNQNENY